MALKKKTEKNEGSKEEPIKNIVDLHKPVTDQQRPEKKNFKFITKTPKEEVQSSGDKSENTQHNEEDLNSIPKIWTDVKENTEEETKLSQEGEYNPELIIKGQFFFKKDDNQIDSISNELANSSEKHNSNVEETEKSVISEKLLKEEEKPKETKEKKCFKFKSKGKLAENKEKDVKNEEIEYQIKSSKDLDDSKETESRKEFNNVKLLIIYS